MKRHLHLVVPDPGHGTETAESGSGTPFTDPVEAQRSMWAERQVEMLMTAFGRNS